METNKIIAHASHEYDDSIYLVEHRSDSNPYGIRTLTGWNNNTHVRYVVVYRGYYEDYEHHGSNYEIARDDFTEAWDEFKELLKKYRFESVELCDHFMRDYGYLYDDGEPYTPSATAGDYSPNCPWNAPGMSIRDFI